MDIKVAAESTKEIMDRKKWPEGKQIGDAAVIYKVKNILIVLLEE